MMTTLEQRKCMDCAGAILVAPYWPHPEQEYTTGHPAYRWDDTKSEEYFVGHLCDACMEKRYKSGATIAGPELEVHL